MGTGQGNFRIRVFRRVDDQCVVNLFAADRSVPVRLGLRCECLCDRQVCLGRGKAF